MTTRLGSSGDSSIIFLATTQASRRCPCPVLPPARFLCILAALLPCPSPPRAPSPSAFHHGPHPLWAGDAAHPAATSTWPDPSKVDNNCHRQQIPADVLRCTQGSHSRVSAIKPRPDHEDEPCVSSPRATCEEASVVLDFAPLPRGRRAARLRCLQKPPCPLSP